jgi:hypothetical protein
MNRLLSGGQRVQSGIFHQLAWPLQIGLEYIRISEMKAWQIFLVGLAVLGAVLLVPACEPWDRDLRCIMHQKS